MNNQFSTNRLNIRKYSKFDCKDIAKLLNNKDIYKTTYAIPFPYPPERAFWWVKFVNNNMKNQSSYEFGVFLKNGEYIGNVGLINVMSHHNKADITYFIEPRHWSNGYATEAVHEMLKFGFDELMLNRIGGICMEENIGSKTVLEKCGFTFEGIGRAEMIKDNEVKNICHYSILKSEYLNSSRIRK